MLVQEKNCRPESGDDDSKKEVIVIRSMNDFPSSAAKLIKQSHLQDTHQQLIDEHWTTFLFVMRFLTRKIYRTPEEFAENPEFDAKRVVCSRTKHGKDLEQATGAFVTSGNPRKMFKVIEDVGRGGFGSVAMVKRLEDRKEVAIKKVPHLTDKEQWSNLDEVHFLRQCAHACVVKYDNCFVNRDEMWVSI